MDPGEALERYQQNPGLVDEDLDRIFGSVYRNGFSKRIREAALKGDEREFAVWFNAAKGLSKDRYYTF